MFSLWKGGVLLGRFAEQAPVTHHGARVGAAGVLEPAESFAETSSVMQTRVPKLPGRPFFQVPLEAGSLGGARTLTPGKKSETTVALKPLSDQEARGISADLVLEVRGKDGRRIDTTMVTLDRRTHREGTARSEESAEYWLVTFSTGADRATGEESSPQMVLPIRIRAVASPSSFGLRLCMAACILTVPHMLTAQQTMPDSVRSTRSGVYTSEQAAQGGEVYAMSCVSCHSAATHTGPAFAARWTGQTLADLFGFIRESMPKNDPGTLSAREYLLAMVYVLQMNGMPPGADPLPGDSLALNRIRIDFPSARDTTRKR